ncbi:MAG: hypothetical protein OQK57_06175 [Ignavibacteriaceae bacterium]|nr:hypothetical protein [Ignavibacteriaceae bacterium]
MCAKLRFRTRLKGVLNILVQTKNDRYYFVYTQDDGQLAIISSCIVYKEKGEEIVNLTQVGELSIVRMMYP